MIDKERPRADQAFLQLNITVKVNMVCEEIFPFACEADCVLHVVVMITLSSNQLHPRMFNGVIVLKLHTPANLPLTMDEV